MQLVRQENFKRKMTEKFDYNFDIEKEGLYLIIISARARSQKQISDEATDDDDLRIEINGRKFPKLDNPQRYLDSPAAFSGGKLHNLKETIYFLINLSKGAHTLTFIPDNEPFLEELSIFGFPKPESEINLDINEVAEDGDCRPWITFALVDLPLKQIQTEIKTERRRFDSDDVKIIIDDEVKRNLRNTFRALWFWVGSFLKGAGETQTDSFDLDLKRNEPHYIEFWADRMPTLYKVDFDFGEPTKRVPNVYDPKWTGDFGDDSEEMILARAIFGEARNQSREAKIAVGWSIKNRLGKDVIPWRNYKTLHDVVLDEGQYDAFSNPEVRPRVENPLDTTSLMEKEAWYESYEIATLVINDAIEDESGGAVFFHDIRISKEEFLRANPNAEYIKQIGNLLFYGLKVL